MVLLLFVLAGLLVMRRRGGATFGLWRVPLPLETGEVTAVVLLIQIFLILILTLFLRKGIIWLILGCVADVPALVSPGSL